MRTAGATRGWGHWSRSLGLAALVALAPACGGEGGTPATVQHGASPDTSPATPAPAANQQSVKPAPVGTGPGRDAAAIVATGQTIVPPPPPPEFATKPPQQAPPNTVSLDQLHRQGKTDAVR